MRNQLRMSRINLEIKNKEKAMALTEKVLEVFKMYDGKELSKRIDTKLKFVDEHLRFTKDSWGNWDCEYSFYDTRYDVESKSYVFNDSYRYFGYYKELSVNFEEIQKQIQKSLDYSRNSLSSLKKQLKQIDKILEKRKKLCEQLNEIHDSIHYIIRHDLDLDNHTFFNL